MIPAGTPATGKPTIDGCLIAAESVFEFTASRFHWSYTETLATPVWLIWQLWRNALRSD